MLFKIFRPFLEADYGTNISGVNEGDPADLQDDDLNNEGEKDSDPADQNKSFKDDPHNKEFAEQRRKEALDAERQKNAKLARDYDIAKKYGGEYGIFSEDDIAAKYGASLGIYNLQQFETALLNQQYQEKGIDPYMINQLIESHPAIRQAKQSQIQSQLKEDFEELKTQFPESGLKNLEDLTTLPTYQAICDKVRRGYSLADAYESTNRAELRSKQQAAAKQKTLNNINSKQHLNTEGDGSGDVNDVHIPEETMRMYIDMGMSKKQAQAHYKKLYKE